jgi:hypothetical protein
MNKIFYIVFCIYILLGNSLKANPIDSLQAIQIQKELAIRLDAQMKQNEANDRAGQSHLNNYIIHLKATFKGQELSSTFVDGGEDIWNIRELEIKNSITIFNNALNQDAIKYYLVIASIYKYTDDINEVYSEDKIKKGIGDTTWKSNQVTYSKYRENGKISANKPIRNTKILENFVFSRFKPESTVRNAIINYIVSFYIPHNGQNLIFHQEGVSYSTAIPKDYLDAIFKQANNSFKNLVNDNTLLTDKTDWLKVKIDHLKEAYLSVDADLKKIKELLKTDEESDCYLRSIGKAFNTSDQSIEDRVIHAQVEFLICKTEEHNLREDDNYWKKYIYGIVNELLYLRIISASDQNIKDILGSIIEQMLFCVQQTNFNGTPLEQFKKILNCIGIQDISNYQALIEASYGYAEREYTNNPYLQGKVNFFLLSTFLPVIGELRIVEGTRNLTHLDKISGVTNLVVFAEKFTELKDAARAARVLNTRIALHKQKRIWQVVDTNKERIREEELEEVLEAIGEEKQKYLDSKNDTELGNIFSMLPANKEAAIIYLKGLSSEPKLFEITILLMPEGAFGAGHAAFLIGNDTGDGQFLYSKERDEKLLVKGVRFDNTEKFISENNSNQDLKYSVAYKIPITNSTQSLEQLKMQAYQLVSSSYNLFTSNCIDACSSMLEYLRLNPGCVSAGAPPCSQKWFPNCRYQDIKGKNTGSEVTLGPTPSGVIFCNQIPDNCDEFRVVLNNRAITGKDLTDCEHALYKICVRVPKNTKDALASELSTLSDAELIAFAKDILVNTTSNEHIANKLHQIDEEIVRAWKLVYDAKETLNYKTDFVLLKQVASMQNNTNLLERLGGRAGLLDIIKKNIRAGCNTCNASSAPHLQMMAEYLEDVADFALKYGSNTLGFDLVLRDLKSSSTYNVLEPSAYTIKVLRAESLNVESFEQSIGNCQPDARLTNGTIVECKSWTPRDKDEEEENSQDKYDKSKSGFWNLSHGYGSYGQFLCYLRNTTAMNRLEYYFDREKLIRQGQADPEAYVKGIFKTLFQTTNNPQGRNLQNEIFETIWQNARLRGDLFGNILPQDLPIQKPIKQALFATWVSDTQNGIYNFIKVK